MTSRALEFLALVVFIFAVYVGFDLIGGEIERTLQAGFY